MSGETIVTIARKLAAERYAQMLATAAATERIREIMRGGKP